MSSVADNIRRIRASLPDNVTLVAVSKFHSKEAITEAYNCGQRIFGESRAQELVQKATALPKDITWHFIGHLQTNKVSLVVPIADIIQSVDTIKLLKKISEESVKIGKNTSVLLQLHVAAEESKFGFVPDEIEDVAKLASNLPNITVRGLMAMASNVDDISRIESDFKKVQEYFLSLRNGIFKGSDFDILSMGMSDDRDIAIACGSTMVRIGTDIFGERE